MTDDGTLRDAPESDEAPGWEAIDKALEALYPGVTPLHLAPAVPFDLGGADPLNGISIHASDHGGRPHWHFVTYGFTELYAKESDDAEWSGFGFELTFRLVRAAGEESPPPWAPSLLMNLARYVFRSGNPFAAGSKMNLNGPIARGATTAIGAVTFTADPELPPIETPNGAVTFLQVVGITEDEWELSTRWNSKALIELLAEGNSLLLTDLARRSLLSEAPMEARIRERVAREGSSQEISYAGSMTWEAVGEGGASVTVGAKHVMTLSWMIDGRLRLGRPFRFVGNGTSLSLEPSESGSSWSFDGPDLVVRIDPVLGEAMKADIAPRRGLLSWPALPGFTLEVVPTEIKDQEGNVVESIG